MARKRRTVAGADDPRRLTDPRNIPIEYNNIEVTVNNLERLAEDILFDCCEETDTDPTEIPPSIWLYTLLEINEKLFRGNKSMLKKHPAEHDEYNAERVLKAYEVYKKLCVKHKQQITIKGFSDMTGINTQTIYNWDSDSKYNAIGYGSSSETLSKRALDLAKTISRDNEQSLEALLLDKSINPVKPLAILNRNHLWNMPPEKQHRREHCQRISYRSWVAQKCAESIKTTQKAVSFWRWKKMHKNLYQNW